MSHEIAATTQTHPDYQEAVEALRTVRDCVKGGWKIKLKGELYLPPRTQSLMDTKEQRERYRRYLFGAEFDEIPALTLRSWLGKMRFGDVSVKLPDVIDYLQQNADGDGTPLKGAIESSASNTFQAKYQIIVADYQGLAGVDLSQLSKAEADALNPRATVKQYTRESLVDWDFRRIDGVMQLAYLKLQEVGYDFDPETRTRQDVVSYLILALDENGHYYQLKEVDGQEGERDYVLVGGQNLKWIPAQIVSDDELPVGKMPVGMGMLYAVCDKTLHRYRMSANYKESMDYITPTIMTKGWQQGDAEIFKEINQRDQIVTGPGAVNNLPNNVDYDVLSASMSMEPFDTYQDRNADQIRAIGGAFKDKPESTQTATEADINAADRNAMLETVANNLEYAWVRILSYCAMFEGAVQPDSVEDYLDNIELSLPRDFATPKLSVEEARVVMEYWREGIYTRKQVAQKLTEGGWGTGQEIDIWLAELEEEAPSVSSLADLMRQQETDNNLTDSEQ